jgi:hypothetical protein
VIASKHGISGIRVNLCRIYHDGAFVGRACSAAVVGINEQRVNWMNYVANSFDVAAQRT